MSSITLDQATIDKLRTSDAPVQILDPQGKVIGTFRPTPRVYKKGEIPDFSEDELRRAFNDSPRMTTTELLSRLEEGK